MLHLLLIAGVYFCAGLLGVCTVEKSSGELLIRLKADRHAIIDLAIATGYCCVGIAGV